MQSRNSNKNLDEREMFGRSIIALALARFADTRRKFTRKIEHGVEVQEDKRLWEIHANISCSNSGGSQGDPGRQQR